MVLQLWQQLPWNWFIWFIYTYITQEVTKKLSEASTALISLIDKIRRLDNDIIRLRTKLNTIITLQEQEKNKNKERLIINSSMKTSSKVVMLVVTYLILTFDNILLASELVHDFKNPSFSGNGYSQHVLSLNQLEVQREQKVFDDAKIC